MSRLTVAVVSDALYPWHKGGKEVRYRHLLNSLPQLDMDVTVYSMKWWDETPDVVNYQAGSLTYFAICPRVPMYRGTRRSVIQALLFAISTLRLLTRKFDVIEADHMPYLQLLPLRLVAGVKRVPLVITWHEVWGKEGWRSYLGRMGYVAELVERVCIKLPTAIIAVSAGTANKLVAMGAKRKHVYVVPNALELDEMQATNADPKAPELLFVGRLLEHKNANLAIDATRVLVDRGRDVHLGIVGVGPEESRLRSQVVELNLETRVTFYATIDSQVELWSLMRGSRVLLAPSVREGFGIVVGESLALGTPVVCVLHPENESSTLVSPVTGSVVRPFDVEAIADAAEYWLGNEEARRTDRVRAFVQEHGEFSVNAMSTSYAEILRKVT